MKVFVHFLKKILPNTNVTPNITVLSPNPMRNSTVPSLAPVSPEVVPLPSEHVPLTWDPIPSTSELENIFATPKMIPKRQRLKKQ
jgi:hypothetical protein